ncbi:hypothetical protein BS78_01G179400 [Paspalum vaginatum]|nr:hypothetical protein BS78_01G179400 [Paspalum vaginatum]
MQRPFGPKGISAKPIFSTAAGSFVTERRRKSLGTGSSPPLSSSWSSAVEGLITHQPPAAVCEEIKKGQQLKRRGFLVLPSSTANNHYGRAKLPTSMIE